MSENEHLERIPLRHDWQPTVRDVDEEKWREDRR